MAARPNFPSFDLEQGDLSKAWGKYVSRLENLLLAMNITSASRKKALLLHYVGEEFNEIFDTLDVEEADRDEDVFKKAEKALREKHRVRNLQIPSSETTPRRKYNYILHKTKTTSEIM